ncbi:hypothetical protein ABZ484_16065 [Streptomyces sp. NPDC006393]|uniref:hypothetical protein n=1 Tax=Streptomyces sp. NPDC006393 TaxID=3156763 RepID=UPI0033F873C6
MFDNQAAGKKLSRRGRTARVATCVGTALIAAGIGMHPAAAGTATGSASRAAAATASTLAGPRLGTGDLIQKADFRQTGLSPVAATVDTTGKQGLSACSGEETMRTLTEGKADAYADVTWTFDTKRPLLTESAAETSTTTSAASYEKRLDQLVRSCQDEPAGHWYYGQGHAITLKTGEGRWYPAFDGDGEAAGGVAVIRSGHRFGIVELSGQPSDDPGYFEGIAATAINRLAA